jgi:hypothetical protein
MEGNRIFIQNFFRVRSLYVSEAHLMSIGLLVSSIVGWRFGTPRDRGSVHESGVGLLVRRAVVIW